MDTRFPQSSPSWRTRRAAAAARCPCRDSPSEIQSWRLVDRPFADEPPDPRAADDEVLVANGIDLLRLESVARAKRAQHREVARAIVAEEEIRADPHLRHAQPVDEHGS